MGGIYGTPGAGPGVSGGNEEWLELALPLEVAGTIA